MMHTYAQTADTVVLELEQDEAYSPVLRLRDPSTGTAASCLRSWLESEHRRPEEARRAYGDLRWLVGSEDARRLTTLAYRRLASRRAE